MCVLAKISLRRPVTTFARLTQSKAVSQSIMFSSPSDQWYEKVSLLFHFLKLFYICNYRFLYHRDQKISWWRICRWRRGRSTLKSTRVVSAWNLTLENAFGGSVQGGDRINWPLNPGDAYFFKVHANGRSLAWTCLKMRRQFECLPGGCTR